MKSEPEYSFCGENDIDKALSLTKSGDKEAFVLLAEKYRSRIVRIAAGFNGIPKSEREDLMQEGFIALYDAALAYDFSKSKFFTFADVCIRHRMINWIEKNINKTTQALYLSEIGETVLSESGAVQRGFEDGIALVDELESLFSSAEKKLSGFESKIFRLYIKGFSSAEMADELSITKKSCDNAISRIKSKLRK